MCPLANSSPQYCLCDYDHANTIRHIDRSLGAPINTFVIAAKTCIDVLREEDAKEVRSQEPCQEPECLLFCREGPSQDFFLCSLFNLEYDGSLTIGLQEEGTGDV